MSTRPAQSHREMLFFASGRAEIPLYGFGFGSFAAKTKAI
jgi:hypothetical protein